MNLLINGSFDIWQRGTEFITPGKNIYTCDRWATLDSQPQKVERVINTCPQSNSLYAVKITLANSYNIFCQPIENFEQMVGGIYTISFCAKASETIVYGVNFGGEAGYKYFTTSKEWKKYVLTGTIANSSVPSRKSIGFFTPSINETGKTIEICDVKLEFGEIATPFIRKPYSEELLNCGRYYQNFSYNDKNTIAIANFHKTWFTIQLPLLTEMRVSNPTINVGGTIRRVDNGQTIPNFIGCTASLSSVAIGGAYTGTPATTYIFSGGISHIEIDAEIY